MIGSGAGHRSGGACGKTRTGRRSASDCDRSRPTRGGGRWIVHHNAGGPRIGTLHGHVCRARDRERSTRTLRDDRRAVAIAAKAGGAQMAQMWIGRIVVAGKEPLAGTAVLRAVLDRIGLARIGRHRNCELVNASADQGGRQALIARAAALNDHLDAGVGSCVSAVGNAA